jgi:transposase-like protein
MTSKTTNKFSPEVRTRAVRMVLDHEGEHASRWAAVVSISAKIGCTPQTLHEWVKKAEIDSGRRYEIFINGAQVGTIARDAVLDLEVPSGTLTIEARIDWGRS